MRKAIVWFLLGFYTHVAMEWIYFLYKLPTMPESFSDTIQSVSSGGRR